MSVVRDRDGSASFDSAVAEQSCPVSHTPGPWSRCGEDRGGCQCGFIWGADRETHVASVHGPSALGTDWYGSDTACSEDAQRANARLIAAAPDILAALKFLVEDVMDYEAWQRPCKAVDDARSAIAKAEGTS